MDDGVVVAWITSGCFVVITIVNVYAKCAGVSMTVRPVCAVSGWQSEGVNVAVVLLSRESCVCVPC